MLINLKISSQAWKNVKFIVVTHSPKCLFYKKKSVPNLGIEPRPLEWKSKILTIGPIGIKELNNDFMMKFIAVQNECKDKKLEYSIKQEQLIKK